MEGVYIQEFLINRIVDLKFVVVFGRGGGRNLWKSREALRRALGHEGKGKPIGVLFKENGIKPL